MAWTHDQMAARAAQELQDGFYVNLGIGLPTLVANHVRPDIEVWLQSENGMLGHRPVPDRGRGRRRPDQRRQADRHHAARVVDLRLHDCFAMIRGGKINLSILGAMQVSEKGDLANWMIPGKMVKGMGGAMDLVAGVKRVIVLMEHVAQEEGRHRRPQDPAEVHPAADRRRRRRPHHHRPGGDGRDAARPEVVEIAEGRRPRGAAVEDRRPARLLSARRR